MICTYDSYFTAFTCAALKAIVMSAAVIALFGGIFLIIHFVDQRRKKDNEEK